MWVYHCNFTLDTSNVSHVPECELISVHRCNCTLDILNLSHVRSCGLVSVYQCNFTLDISSLSHVPERGLVSVYHCSFILDISSCRYIAWYFKLSHVPGCGLLRWMSCRQSHARVCRKNSGIARVQILQVAKRNWAAKSCFDVQKIKDFGER